MESTAVRTFQTYAERLNRVDCFLSEQVCPLTTRPSLVWTLRLPSLTEDEPESWTPIESSLQ